MTHGSRVTVGFPRMHREPNERRDFLPPLIGLLAANGAEVHLESGIGSGMGYTDLDYSMLSPDVVITDEEDCYRQDMVVVLRAPEGKYERLRPGAVLVSMLHFATRPARVRMLRELGIDAISLDLVRNDDGRRLVENLRSVAWNGISSAFAALERTWPELAGPRHSTVKVLIMGAGRVGRHAVEFATKYGDDARNDALTRAGLPGVEVLTAGRNLTGDPEFLKRHLLMTDLLVDATARRDPSRALIPNAWLALLPSHAVICDLSVDPYLLDVEPRVVRGIEGIPQGNLDQWEFAPDDPAWATLPQGIPTGERRTVVSCYSWPGVRPEPCMHVYGSQLAPLLAALVTAGGLDGIKPEGSYFEQALWRGSLRGWFASSEAELHGGLPDQGEALGPLAHTQV
jgi:alanine dehydrogenase